MAHSRRIPAGAGHGATRGGVEGDAPSLGSSGSVGQPRLDAGSGLSSSLLRSQYVSGAESPTPSSVKAEAKLWASLHSDSPSTSRGRLMRRQRSINNPRLAAQANAPADSGAELEAFPPRGASPADFSFTRPVHSRGGGNRPSVNGGIDSAGELGDATLKQRERLESTERRETFDEYERWDRVQLERATAYVLAAVHGRRSEIGTSFLAVRLHSIYHSRLWKIIVALAIAAHCFLSIVEAPQGVFPSNVDRDPTVCIDEEGRAPQPKPLAAAGRAGGGSDALFGLQRNHTPAPHNGSTHHPNYYCGGALVPWSTSVTIEAIPLLVYAVDIAMRLVSRALFVQTEHAVRGGALVARWCALLFRSDRWLLAQVALALLFTADVAVSLVVIVGLGASTFRFSRALRPVMFLLRFRNLRKTFRTLIGAWRNLAILFSLILLQCAAFGVAGYLLLHKSKQPAFDSIESAVRGESRRPLALRANPSHNVTTRSPL